ncbi:lasso peptide isopeptide bond-forming cyclase [Peribacillus butanolivorans]|uniref:lasso peptide isopeptide bond-forming cyclase n=1 Tax=Peribacillus butanolivorans TaxID=421767 RepID=UPI00366DA46F
MSAITGIYHLNEEPVNLQYGRNLMTALQKYPADSIQIWHSEKVFLGCHAQWITPESVGEQLPFHDSERQCTITADAIIDNREELFDKLHISKIDRSILTDSQLILLSYQKWGEETPRHLIGDFAFMIWDQKKRKLFGARDFAGSRTLYYHKNHEKFTFCTTIEPLLKLPYIEKKLNEQWLAEFLAIPGMNDTVDAFSTVYKNIDQIPPSHTLSIVENKVMLSRYCSVVDSEKLHLKSNNEYEEAFRDVFQRAATSRLRTHRKVGANLSGGLDSGSVVSFAAKALRNQNKKLHTFSSIPINEFNDWTPNHLLADERPLINATVEHVGNINAQYLKFEGRSPLSELDDWLEVMEMPYKFFENSVWVKGIYEKANQLGIGVLLNGARGNFTISWGPALDYYALLLRKMRWIRLYHEVNSYSENMGVKRSRVIKVVGKKAYPFFNNIIKAKKQHDSPDLINDEFARSSKVFSKLEESGINIMGVKPTNINEIRRNHFEFLNMWNTTGTSGTKLSLKYSLQGHDPTNDLRVIQFCLSLPLEQFVQNGLDRALIRRSTNGYLPEKVRLNQQIRGIQGVDTISRMISEWKDFIFEIEQLTKDPLMSNFLNMSVIKNALNKIRVAPQPEFVFDHEFRTLMRSLIVYRFIKKLI